MENLNMLMDARVVNFPKFLDENLIKFTIPNYQREYVWKWYNCKKLIDDMMECVNDKQDKGHFIGSIVYKQRNSYSPRDLVDGQQRITTIMLILKVLNLLDTKNTIKEETKKILFINENNEQRLKLTFNNKDKNVFKYIMHLQSYDGSENKEWSNNHIFQNFRYIYNELKTIINDGEYLVENIYKKGITNFYLIDVSLHDKVNPQEIFESINSLGMKLSPVDEIKNYLLWKLDNANEIFENTWKPMEEKIGNEKMNDFIMDYLMAQEAHVVKGKNLYHEYKEYAQKMGHEGKDSKFLIEDLAKYANYYSSFLGKNKDEYSETINELLTEIREIGLTTVYSFLLRVFDDEKSNKIDEKILAQILNLLVVYLVRRIICEIPSAGLRGFMASLYKRISLNNYENEKYYASIYKFLCDHVNSEQKMQSSENTMTNLIGKIDLYKKLPKFTKYLLFTIENGRYSNPNDYKLLIKDVTIEHIIPQQYEKDESWIKILGSDSGEVKEWLNTLGNLTLLPRKDNAKASNNSYETKKKIYLQGKLNNLNSQVNEYDEFNLDKLHKRANKLANDFSNLYQLNVPNQAILDTINFDADENYKEKVSLNSTDVDVTGKKPISYTLMGKEQEVSSWPDILVGVCEYCSQKDLKKVLNCFSRDKNEISEEPNQKYASQQIPGTEYFITTHGSSKELFAKIQKLIYEFNLDGSCVLTIKKTKVDEN